MAKEWGPRNGREVWSDHNLEEGLAFTWGDGSEAKIVQQMREPRIYKVSVKGMNRITTEPYILQCMKAAGEDPQINLYYSAWPFSGDIRKGQKIVVSIVAMFVLGVIVGSVVLLLAMTH